MTINKDHVFDNYSLECDICGDDAGEEFDDFIDAVNWKKEEGWKSKKDKDGDWIDVCDSCLAEEE